MGSSSSRTGWSAKTARASPQPLPLPTGERGTVLPDRSMQVHRQSHRRQCVEQLFVGGVRLGHAQIRGDVGVEHVRDLRGPGTSERMSSPASSDNCRCPGARRRSIQESSQHVQDRRLARSRLAHQADAVADRQMEINVPDGDRSGRVGGVQPPRDDRGSVGGFGATGSLTGAAHRGSRPGDRLPCAPGSRPVPMVRAPPPIRTRPGQAAKQRPRG